MQRQLINRNREALPLRVHQRNPTSLIIKSPNRPRIRPILHHNPNSPTTMTISNHPHRHALILTHYPAHTDHRHRPHHRTLSIPLPQNPRNLIRMPSIRSHAPTQNPMMTRATHISVTANLSISLQSKHSNRIHYRRRIATTRMQININHRTLVARTSRKKRSLNILLRGRSRQIKPSLKTMRIHIHIIQSTTTNISPTLSTLIRQSHNLRQLPRTVRSASSPLIITPIEHSEPTEHY